MERTDDESLVDGKLLSYSYLEAGVIEMLGAYVDIHSSTQVTTDIMRTTAQSGRLFRRLLQKRLHPY